MESEAKTVSGRWVVKFNIFLREGKGFLSRMHIPFLGRNTKDEELCCCCCCAQQRDEKPAKLNFRLRSFFLYPRGSNPACKDSGFLHCRGVEKPYECQIGLMSLLSSWPSEVFFFLGCTFFCFETSRARDTDSHIVSLPRDEALYIPKRGRNFWEFAGGRP